jgi:hypothetical protein
MWNDPAELERLAILRRPPAPNPAELMRGVRVKCIKPFFVAGRCVEIGEVVCLEEHVARDLVFLKKCERCCTP